LIQGVSQRVLVDGVLAILGIAPDELAAVASDPMSMGLG
jgi:hypothetical protein